MNYITFIFLYALISLSYSKKSGDSEETTRSMHVYFVSASGNDGNSGSVDKPFGSIGKALGLVIPGDTVIVRGGTYYEQISLSKSGLPGKNITVKAYPGERPVIDGSRVVVSGWMALVTMRSVRHIVLDGLDICNLSSASGSADPEGIFINGSGTKRCAVVHNTLSGNDRTAGAFGEIEGEIRLTEHCDSNTIVNNIVYGGGTDVFVHKYTSTGGGNVFANNHYYTAGSPQWIWGSTNGTALTILKDWQTACGGDVNAVYGDKGLDGVQQLAKRRVPWLADHLVLTVKDKQDGQEGFDLSTRNGEVHIAATGANAAAEGLGWYLKYYCHRSMSHMGDNLSPVYPLPGVPEPVKVRAGAAIRYALNYCTYNYSMSFYTWKDWERELDWMALNGVNAMLVANGAEAVWKGVLEKIGYTQKEIDAFITGPAYNAWWLMGNIQGWGGPMPTTQIESRAVLVQKMLAHMRELGIEPVMPAFFGMVPSTLKDKIKAHVIVQGNWGAFTRPDMIDPTDTAFDRLADLFYEETQKRYGKGIRFFSGDPFHEGGITEGVDLGKAGANIQKAMQRWFPGAVWVLQGWQENPRAQMLAGLDRSKVLVQELFGETTNNWEKRKAYEGTPFVWCMITNYGERPGLFGKLQRYASEPYRAAHGEYGPYLKGVGIMPEGIDNNPVAYDLMLEVGWHQEQINAEDWIKGYALYRYGKYNKDILSAWKLLLQTIYSSPEGYQEGPPENILCARPALEIQHVSSWGTIKKRYDEALFSQAVRLFARAAPQFKGSETYRIDLINFTRQAIANAADTVFSRIVEAYRQKNEPLFNTMTARFLELEDSAERLLNKDAYYRLETYQRQALSSGATPEEKKNNLHNALMLVTYWGENNRKEDYLHEYAYKEWAGMMVSFYGQRWKMYFEYLSNQLKGIPSREPDFFAWERAWVSAREKSVVF